MINFVEVNSGSDKCIINMNQIHKIVPVVGGVGCVFHFDNGKTQNVSDSYDIIKTVLTGSSSHILTEEIKTIKKDSEKVKS